mgnify:CR=1 FL=1
MWNGFEYERFEFDGKEAIIVFPDEFESEKNWLLKTEYWDAFPQIEIEMLKKGFCLAYVGNDSRFAAESDCTRKMRFVEYISKKYNLRNKCVPVGYSCGGAHAVNFAGIYPDSVCCLYLDAPVLNFCDYPGRLNDQGCERIWNEEFLTAYPGITRAGLLQFEHHPMNKIKVLKKYSIPIIMLYGTQDTTVDYNKNGRILELEYEDSSDLISVIPRFLQGHHPHGSINNSHELIDLIWNKSHMHS